VRGAVTLYVFSVVPLLLFLLGLTVVNLPRVLATAWDSMLLQNVKLHHHVALHAYPPVAVDAIQMAVLALPVAGLFATFWKLGRTVFSGLWDRTEGRQLARTTLVAATTLLVLGAAYSWLPNGDYHGIQATERGTIGGGISELTSIPGRRSQSPFPGPGTGQRTPAPPATPRHARTTTAGTTTGRGRTATSRAPGTTTPTPTGARRPTSGTTTHRSSTTRSGTTTPATSQPIGTEPVPTDTTATSVTTETTVPTTTRTTTTATTAATATTTTP
jgi:hypothetical protein